MNDLEMYREQLAMCDDKLIDALVERNGIIEKIIGPKEVKTKDHANQILNL